MKTKKSKEDMFMSKKILAMVLLFAILFNMAGCSAVDTGSGNGSNINSSKASVKEDLLNETKYKSNKAPSDWTIAVVVKDGTSDWFKRMQVGVDEFGKAKTVNVIQKGPANADAASQVQLVEDMVNQGVDALCVIPIDPGALESVLQKAMEKGIVVVSHEASDLKNTLYDVEAFTAEDFGNTMMQELAKAMGESGQYAQMVAYTTSTTHMEYSKAEYAYQKENYKNMSLINDTVPSAESAEKVNTAYEKAKELLKANPELRGFTGAASVDILGEAQATEELGLTDKVSIVGVGTPNATRDYINSGTISAVCLWDPAAAGYAMCNLAYMILAGEEIKEGINLGQKGYESVTIQKGSNRCILGNAPLILTKDNINDYDF